MAHETNANDHLSGVACDAHNCVYNDGSCDRCTAQEIRVGTTSAVTSSETICDTFRLK